MAERRALRGFIFGSGYSSIEDAFGERRDIPRSCWFVPAWRDHRLSWRSRSPVLGGQGSP